MGFELKPCPFCGGTHIRFDLHRGDRDVWSMCCYDCGATFPNRYKKELLVECWNRRPAAYESAKPVDGAPNVGDPTMAHLTWIAKDKAYSDEYIGSIFRTITRDPAGTARKAVTLSDDEAFEFAQQFTRFPQKHKGEDWCIGFMSTTDLGNFVRALITRHIDCN